MNCQVILLDECFLSIVQVYIVAMKDASVKTGNKNGMSENEAADDDEFGESRNGREEDGLLNLVKPELISLSKHWLAALKDHALLSLPQGQPFSFHYLKLLSLPVNL